MYVSHIYIYACPFGPMFHLPIDRKVILWGRTRLCGPDWIRSDYYPLYFNAGVLKRHLPLAPQNCPEPWNLQCCPHNQCVHQCRCLFSSGYPAFVSHVRVWYPCKLFLRNGLLWILMLSTFSKRLDSCSKPGRMKTRGWRQSGRGCFC